MHTHRTSLHPLAPPFHPPTRHATRKAFCVCQGVGQCKSITPSSNVKAINCVCVCACVHTLHKEAAKSFVMHISLCHAITWHCSPSVASSPSLFLPSCFCFLIAGWLHCLRAGRQHRPGVCWGGGWGESKEGWVRGDKGEQHRPQWTAVT